MAGIRSRSHVVIGIGQMMRRQTGVALVLVLWVMTLLAVIAGNFAFSMRGEAQIARNLLFNVQAKTRADAGVQLAWFELVKPSTDPLRWQANGVAHEFMMDGAAVRVSILDESGKIDLNTAPDELLKGLFKSAGLSEDASASLLNIVLDWRSPGNLRRLNGAKEEQYRAAGKNYGPPNSPFETVDELQGVLGMSLDLYRKLAPALTVYSRQPGINPVFASREALLAIPGINPATIEQFLLQRHDALATGQPVLPLAGAGIFSSSSRFSAYSVRSEARMPDGTAFVRQTVLRLTPEVKQPVVVLSWSEGDAEPAARDNTATKN